MSGGVFCRCPGPIAARRKHWRTMHRYHNHSAFNGYHYTASAYSTVECTKCQGIWHTKADYVDALPGPYCISEELSKEHK